MSLPRKFLFTDDSPRLVLDLDEQAQAFGPSYGNRRASGKQFREPWTHRGRKIARVASNATDARDIAACC